MPKKIIKLHLGCGIIAPEDWINIDGSWNAWLAKHQLLKFILKKSGLINKKILDIAWPENIVIQNLAKPLKYKKNSVDFVYSAHTLEHLYLFQARDLLKECYRILKPGGVLRIMVPDLEKYIEDYVLNKKHKQNDLKTRGDIFLSNLLIISQDKVDGSLISKVYNYLNNTNSHKWMYDRESLIFWFKEAGFKSIEKKDLFKSKIEGIQEVEPAERFAESICIEGIKTKK